MSETGITTSVLKGANVAKDANGTYVSSQARPEGVPQDVTALAQDDLAQAQGYGPLLNAPVEHVSPGREAVRGLPGNLQTSPHN